MSEVREATEVKEAMAAPEEKPVKPRRKPLVFGTGIARTFGVTLKHFFGRRITVQYPRQHNVIAERSRGAVKMKGIASERTGAPTFSEMPPCQARCPANVDARGYIGLIAQGRYDDAYELHLETNPLPDIIGHICPNPCETVCRKGEEDAPVTICLLKRFLSDNVSAGRRKKVFSKPKESKDKKVAIVGAGPAGLSAAYYLTKCGYEVVIFERLPIAGGVLRADALANKLPARVIDQTVGDIKMLGVAIRTNTLIGPGGMSLDDIFNDGFKAIFMGIGAHRRQAAYNDDGDKPVGRGEKNKWLIEQGVELDAQGNIGSDKETGATSRQAVYAAGEAAVGPTITVNAVGGSRRAALAIDILLNGRPSEFWSITFPKIETIKKRYDPDTARAQHDKTEPAFAEKIAIIQAERCLSCSTEECIGCHMCEKYCPPRAISIKTSGGKEYRVDSYEIDYGRCQLCGICVEVCPTRTLTHTKEFEMADYTRGDAVYGKDKMLRRSPLRKDSE
ncbi:MAG: FAD-dependent oxidoreductase [Actinomycetota bacterium]